MEIDLKISTERKRRETIARKRNLTKIIVTVKKRVNIENKTNVNFGDKLRQSLPIFKSHPEYTNKITMKISSTEMSDGFSCLVEAC